MYADDKVLAPVAVSTYARVNHLRETVQALKKNTLASQSHVYFLSDAPRQGDEKAVAEVRQYLKTIDGFASVTIFERETNDRVKNNRGGIEYLLDKHDKVIFLEEDVVTAPGFLEFINAGLIKNRDDQNVFAVGGHTPNLIGLKNINSDFYCVRRFHGWGFGIWKNRYEEIGPLPSWKEIKNEPLVMAALMSMGADMISMVKLEAAGRINAFDIRSCYFLAKNKEMKMLLPRQTLVTNIGLDGTGEHCDSTDIYINHKLWGKVEFNFDGDLEFSRVLLFKYFFFYSALNVIPRFKRRFFKV
tara:strand:+ start:4034 stop:4936 length:903 start_codon:yes stop_codon:yes gene_type:complete